MKRIGITGGVGAGKSIVLDLLSKACHCKVLQADRLAWELEEPGGVCYKPLVDLLGDSILRQDGTIDRSRMSALIFEKSELVRKVNAIVHPKVKEAADHQASVAEAEGYDYFFFEAALLIEASCDEILDEVWYVYAPRKERLRRLMQDRGYTEEKARLIMRTQLSEKEFRSHADRVIMNNKEPEQVMKQLAKWLT